MRIVPLLLLAALLSAALGTSVTRAQSPQSAADLTDSAATRKVRQALTQPGSMSFESAPLSEVVKSLHNRYRIPVLIDTEALSAAEIEPSVALTLEVDGISLRSALRHLLRPAKLTFAVRDEVLLITTPEVAESHMDTRVYDVSDLVMVPGSAEADPDTFIDLIIGSIATNTWEDVGGTGTAKIMRDNARLVISQTEEAHEDIEALFQKLRALRPSSPSSPSLTRIEHKRAPVDPLDPTAFVVTLQRPGPRREQGK